MEFLFDNGDQHVSGHGAPDLRLHRVLARSEKFLDAQMLLDPFEEQFHLPAALVQCGDGQRRQGRIVGEEYQRLARLGICEFDTPYMLGIVLGNIKSIERDSLVADYPGLSVGLGRIHPTCAHAAFGARHKESAGLMHFVALLNFEWVIFSNIYPGGETYLTRNRMAACQESALFVMAVAAQKPRPQPFPSLFVPARRQGFASPNRKKRGSPLTPFRDFSDAKSMPGHPTYPLRFQKKLNFGRSYNSGNVGLRICDGARKSFPYSRYAVLIKPKGPISRPPTYGAGCPVRRQLS